MTNEIHILAIVRMKNSTKNRVLTWVLFFICVVMILLGILVILMEGFKALRDIPGILTLIFMFSYSKNNLKSSKYGLIPVKFLFKQDVLKIEYSRESDYNEYKNISVPYSSMTGVNLLAEEGTLTILYKNESKGEMKEIIYVDIVRYAAECKKVVDQCNSILETVDKAYMY